VVKVIWHKTASPPQTNGSIDLPGGANVPKKEATLASPGEYDWTCASFSTPESTAQTANRSVQPFLHRSWQKVPILYNGRPFPPKLPILVGDRAHNPNCIMIGSAIFAQVTAECHYTLKLPLSKGIWTPCKTRFLGPIRVHKPNGISISSAVFLHRWPQSVPILYKRDAPFPLIIAPSHGGDLGPI